MIRPTDPNQLPTELAKAIHETTHIITSYLAGLAFIVQDTARDPSYLPNHLLSPLSQDILQSVVSISALATEGLLQVARRELRFLLEASVKIALVQQKGYSSTISEKLVEFERQLSSQNISIKREIRLSLLPEPLRGPFLEEVGRLYGLTSNFVHLNPLQITAAIAAAEAGVTAGRERPSDVSELNRLAERCLAASLVLLFHSVPEWVAGDWLVEANGNSRSWHFMRSRFIAGIDSKFDYKAERQATLSAVKQQRDAGIQF